MQKSLLFIPGPVAVCEPVLAAMAKPLINHRGPEYARLLHSIARRMQSIFLTKGDVLLMGSSGTGSLEAAVTNMFAPGDTVLACPTGVFGERIAAIAKMWGCAVETLETPWGAGVDPRALAARLHADREKRITGILLTHNETSTGVQIDLGAISRAIGDHPAYVVVDSVSGLGASEFKMDEWKLDIVCAASQKALACPPGLAMIAVSSRAWNKIKANKAPRFYFDLQKHKEFFDKGEPPWTPPVSVAFALDVAIDLYEKEGPRKVWARHARYTGALHEAVKALGMEIFSRDGVHSVTVTGILSPPGLDNRTVLTKLLDEHGVVISGGQDKMAGKMWRWGTMGAISETDMIAALRGFEIVIKQMGHRFEDGVAVNAARDLFAKERKKTPGEKKQVGVS
jgi:aspartate aminotransferase-like enzyme